MLTLWLICSLIFVFAAGCRQTPEPQIGPRADVTYLKKGEPAPYAGYHLTPRMLTILYREARTREARETIRDLRERYGRGDEGD